MTFTITIPGWLPIVLIWLSVVLFLSGQALKDARNELRGIGTSCYWLIQIGIYIVTIYAGMMIGWGLNGT